MESNTYDASIADFSSAISSSAISTPLQRQSTSWEVSWTPTHAPTIAQLARHIADQSDQPSVSDRFLTQREYPSKSDEEKQQGDYLLASANTSDFFDTPFLEPPQPSMTKTREAAFIFITCISQFLSLSALNQTVSPMLLIADHFHVEDYGTLSWFAASFSMSVGTFILPAGTFNKVSPQFVC
jgi:hypothetical protein